MEGNQYQKVILGAIVAQLTVLVVIAVILWSGIAVTETDPVVTVEVSEIGEVVQVAVPVEADLYGFCRKQGTGYVLSITAVTGGLAQTVAEGTFTESAAIAIGRYASQYYANGLGMDFGDSSKDCSQLSGWR